jgi:hypothetical protein
MTPGKSVKLRLGRPGPVIYRGVSMVMAKYLSLLLTSRQTTLGEKWHSELVLGAFPSAKKDGFSEGFRTAYCACVRARAR